MAVHPRTPLVTDETFALAQERLARNAQFAKRNTRAPGPLQGLVVCRECGYSCYRTSVRTTKRKIVYYRCIGQDNWRHVGGRVCHSRPIRADELEPLVWGEVRRLLENPTLVRSEIDRRLAALRTEHPAARRREALERDLTRATQAVERLIEAYQEQLLSLDELRARMPTLRKRQSTLQAQLDALASELHDAETYLKLADTVEGFLDRLAEGLDHLDVTDEQRILRLVVREVLVGGDEDKITIRHSIPTPNGAPDGSYPLRGSSQRRPLWGTFLGRLHQPAIHDARFQIAPDQPEHLLVIHPSRDSRHQRVVLNSIEKRFEVKIGAPRRVIVDELACPLDSVMLRAPRPVAEAVGMEMRVEDRREHLR